MRSTFSSTFLAALVLSATLTPRGTGAASTGVVRAELAAALAGNAVAGAPLGEYLTSLDASGCLQDVETELVAGLKAIKGVFTDQVEATTFDHAWKAVAPQLDGFSGDGRLLVATWLDNQELARSRFFCEDSLPSSWMNVSTTRHVVEAVLWFDLAIAEREKKLIEGNEADRERAVIELLDLRRELTHRYQATYASDENSVELLGALEERLALMWEVLVEPFHLGFAPKALLDSEDGDWVSASGTASLSSNAFYGMDIPDPRDVAKRDKVRRSWRIQTNTLKKEARELSTERERITDAITFAADGDSDELNPLVREAMQLDMRLGQVQADLAQLEHRVRGFKTLSPVVASMVANRPTKGTVKAIARVEDSAETDRQELSYAVNDALMRGASTPDQLMPSSLDDAVASLSKVDLSLIGDPNALPSPGNWIAGIPGYGTGVDRDESARLAVEKLKGLIGTGWVERAYEGPIIAPSRDWSRDLVESVREQDDSIDEIDARILLGLIEAAYSELPDRPAVELAVRYAMRRGGGLQLTGNESQLSELYNAELAPEAQQELVFVLKLLF